MKRFKKAILITGIVLLGIIITVFIYLSVRKSNDFESLIKAKLQQVVRDASDSLYSLQMDKVVIDVVNSKISLQNAKLLIDSSRLQQLDALQRAPDDVYKISLRSLVIEGIGIKDFLDKKNIDLTAVVIEEPTAEIFHDKKNYNAASADTSSLYNRISKAAGNFSLNNLLVQHIHFIHHNINKEGKITEFKDVSLHLKDIAINNQTQYDTSRFLFAKDAVFNIKDYELKTPDSLYIFKIDSVKLHAAAGYIHLKKLSLKPRGNKENFSRQLKFYKDRYDITAQEALIQKINWYNLINGDDFTAKSMTIKNGDVEVFADRSLPMPGKDKVGNYPQQLLMKLQLPVEIDTVHVNSFKVTYKEFNPKAKKAGALVFDGISSIITNLTNKKECIAINKFCFLDANAKLMNAGNVNVHFAFNLPAAATSGTFTLAVDLQQMDGTLLNPVTMPLGLYEVKSLQINRLKMQMQGSNYSATGSVLFLYNNLKVNVLKEDDDKPNKVKKRGIISFFANALLKNDNPSKGKTAQPQQVSVKRDPLRSFFSLIWQTVRGGVKATVM